MEGVGAGPDLDALLIAHLRARAPGAVSEELLRALRSSSPLADAAATPTALEVLISASRSSLSTPISAKRELATADVVAAGAHGDSLALPTAAAGTEEASPRSPAPQWVDAERAKKGPRCEPFKLAGAATAAALAAAAPSAVAAAADALGALVLGTAGGSVSALANPTDDDAPLATADAASAPALPPPAAAAASRAEPAARPAPPAARPFAHFYQPAADGRVPEEWVNDDDLGYIRVRADDRAGLLRARLHIRGAAAYRRALLPFAESSMLPVLPRAPRAADTGGGEAAGERRRGSGSSADAAQQPGGEYAHNYALGVRPASGAAVASADCDAAADAAADADECEEAMIVRLALGGACATDAAAHAHALADPIGSTVVDDGGASYGDNDGDGDGCGKGQASTAPTTLSGAVELASWLITGLPAAFGGSARTVPTAAAAPPAAAPASPTQAAPQPQPHGAWPGESAAGPHDAAFAALDHGRGARPAPTALDGAAEHDPAWLLAVDAAPRAPPPVQRHDTGSPVAAVIARAHAAADADVVNSLGAARERHRAIEHGDGDGRQADGLYDEAGNGLDDRGVHAADDDLRADDERLGDLDSDDDDEDDETRTESQDGSRYGTQREISDGEDVQLGEYDGEEGDCEDDDDGEYTEDGEEGEESEEGDDDDAAAANDGADGVHPHVQVESGGLDPLEQRARDLRVLDSFQLKVIYRKDKTGFEEDKEFPVLINSVIAARYQVVEYLGSAAFSKAVQCYDLEEDRTVCIKIIKNSKDFFDQSIDEIKLLQLLNTHDPLGQQPVLRLFDFFYHKEHLFIVCELLRDNLYEASKFNRESEKAKYFNLRRLRSVARQCLQGLAFIHDLNLIHCDLKPENILIKSYSRCEVKIIDFGSSCFTTDHLSSYVQSRSYRAPEVILGMPYDQRIDIWSLGCILAELWTGYVLFQNDSVTSMLCRMAGVLGAFDPKSLATGRHSPKYFTADGLLYERVRAHGGRNAGYHHTFLHPKMSSLRHRLRVNDELFLSFVGSTLATDPEKRPTSDQCLQHPWLTTDPYEGVLAPGEEEQDDDDDDDDDERAIEPR